MIKLRYLVLAILIATTANVQTNADDLDLVHIAGDSFVMGSGSAVDNPSHQVTVSSFRMAVREITTGEFREFTVAKEIPFRWTSYNFTQYLGRPAGYVVPDDYAMYFVMWYEAIWYANYRSEKEGLQKAYEFDEDDMWRYLYDFEQGREAPEVVWHRDADGYRLPTEAEWEFSATERGKMETLSDEAMLRQAWIRENASGRVQPIKNREPSSLGLYDILGNVSEWCWDYYQPDYYESSPVLDPAGPTTGAELPVFQGRTDTRVFRGCSWRTPASYCGPRRRMTTIAPNRGSIGIRLVRNAE